MGKRASGKAEDYIVQRRKIIEALHVRLTQNGNDATLRKELATHKNRLSASISRLAARNYMTGLAGQVSHLNNTNEKLHSRISDLEEHLAKQVGSVGRQQKALAYLLVRPQQLVPTSNQ